MKNNIDTALAPKAIGTYSQAICANNIVYISGQIPLDPKTMTMVSGDFESKVKQVFENINAIALASGGNLSKIVKMQVFLLDLNHFSIINDIMATYFEKPYPARAVLQVSRLPKDAEIEIDAILHV